MLTTGSVHRWCMYYQAGSVLTNPYLTWHICATSLTYPITLVAHSIPSHHVQVVASDLDIFPGQSGSNVWDSDLYTRALVNAEGGDGRAYHRTMTRSVFNFVVDNSKVRRVV